MARGCSGGVTKLVGFYFLNGPFDEGVCLKTAALNKHLHKRHLLSKKDFIGDSSTNKSYLENYKLKKQSEIAVVVTVYGILPSSSCHLWSLLLRQAVLHADRLCLAVDQIIQMIPLMLQCKEAVTILGRGSICFHCPICRLH